jgi:hypothetical protein
MGEIDYYPELCIKFSDYLLNYLPVNSIVKFAYNDYLDILVNSIESEFNTKYLSESYLPKLKLDILFGIQLPGNSKINYILFEIKYLKQLSIAEYSQLVGYLQVAQHINIGILLLVIKPETRSVLSNDFSEIINMKYLPMEWQMIFNKNVKNTGCIFNAGICYYTPNNGIEWIDTKQLNGISSFEELSNIIT